MPNRARLYGIIVFLYWMSQYLYMPTLPLYAQSKTDSLTMVGVVLAMYGLWQTLVRIPLGMAADWAGWRKPFIIAGVLLSGVGAWLTGASDHVNLLIIGRALCGVAAGTWVLFVVGFSTLFPPGEAVRATAILTVCASLGRMLATAPTGILNTLGGYSLAFYLAAGIAVIATLTALPIHEQRRVSQRPSLRDFKRLLKDRDVMLPSIINAICQHATWASTYGFIPIIARQLGATDIMQSVLLSLTLAVIVVGSMIAASLGHYIGNRRLVYLSLIFLFVGVSSAALASSLLLIFVAQFCLGLSWGFGNPVLMGMSIERVADSERATAMGIHQAVYGLGMFSGPWLSGILSDFIGIQPTLGITGILCFLLGVSGMRWLGGKPEKHDAALS